MWPLSLSLPWVTSIAFAAGLAAGGYSMRAYYEAKTLRAEARIVKAERVAVAKDAKRARAYSTWRQEQQPRTAAIEQEIEREIRDHRDWADERVPDSVRLDLEAAAAGVGASSPSRAVPGVPGDADRDER